MAIVAAARLPTFGIWENAGVEGGITFSTILFADVTDAPYNADDTGATSAVSAIQDAINDCPSGQFVYVPPGAYLIDSELSLKSGVTLRGAAKVLTTFDLRTTVVIEGAIASFPPPKVSGGIAISSGSTRGSTVITVVDTTAVTVGEALHVNELDDFDFVWTKNDNPQRYRGSLHNVVSKTSTTITFEPALQVDYDSTPEYSMYGSWIEDAGIEGIGFDLINGTAGRAVDFEMAWNCWLFDCKVINQSSRTVWINWSGHVEIRKCDMLDQTAGGPNSEGIELFTDAYWSLVTDNICIASGFPQISIGGGGASENYTGCQGNVISYNYCIDAWTKSPPNAANIQPADIGMNHSPHQQFNLAEGNYTGKIHADCFHGSASHGTLLRNRILGMPTSYPLQDENMGVMLDRRNQDYNVVGNIIGKSGDVATYEFIDQDTGFLDTESTIFRLGFPFVGNSNVSGTHPPTDLEFGDGGPLDEFVQRDNTTNGTTLIEGNWNSVDDAQDWTITPETIPDSYYLTERPTFFGNLVWPPYDPAIPTAEEATLIPAGWRAINGNEDYFGLINAPKTSRVKAALLI